MPPKRRRNQVRLQSDARSGRKPSKPSSSVHFGLRLCLAVVVVVLIPSVLWGRRGGLSNIYPYNQYGEEKFESFEVADIPGRGKGVIASKNIRQGELILREKPLFVLPHQITTSPSALVLSSVNQLTSAKRSSFYNLSYVHLPNDVGIATYDEQVALAIFQTNAVAAGDGVGLFPRMARLNHGCSSAFNVVYSWREREEMIVVYALKEIRKGQVCIIPKVSAWSRTFMNVYRCRSLTTYTNTKRPRHTRREYLSQNYDFDCACTVCSLPSPQSHASDERLMMMSHLQERLATWSQGEIDGREAIEVCRLIWAAGEEEGYWSERGSLAADAAWVAAAHGEARLAEQWYSIELGGDSHHSLEMKKLAANARIHPVWGTRERMDVGGPLGMQS